MPSQSAQARSTRRWGAPELSGGHQAEARRIGRAPDRLQADYTGIRPKISGPGEPAADFRIDGPGVHGTPGLVNLMGIESPGLTACMAIADNVASLLGTT